jgi:hypothetical protein
VPVEKAHLMKGLFEQMMLYIKVPKEEEGGGMIFYSYNTKPLHKLGLWLYDKSQV